MVTATARTFRGALPAPPLEPPPVIEALRHAAADPDGAAIVDGLTGERLSRGELAERSAGLAAGLAERGIGRGDVVALAMPNLAGWPVVALGVWRTGAALAPLNPVWGAEEMGRVLALVQPCLGIASGPRAAALQGALTAAGIAGDVMVDDETENAAPLARLPVDAGQDPFAEPSLAPDDLALVPFSSGTGGLPKGVRLTNGNLSVASADVATVFASGGTFDSDSVVLAGAPFCNIMGFVLALCGPLSVGAQIVTLPIPRTDQVLEVIAAHRVTHAIVPPPIVAEIAADASAEHYDTSDLQFVASGGAHVPVAQQLRAGERLGCLVRQGYGMTEASTISAPMGRPSDPATVGWLGAGMEARLVDPESGRDVAPGEAGELWIRGPQVMDGYFDDPDATAATITADGWLRTGDLVTIREDGQVVIEDRLKELIKVKGASVAPAELELVLRQHPSVRDAAVVGRPDAKRGEVPVAWVVLSGSATPDELVSFVRSRVAAHKRLHDVKAVDELPRMPSGKLQRRALRDREREVTSRADGEVA
jgi:acyl-CoA synthetase (AMP-forming)/AMP-acid ligase II